MKKMAGQGYKLIKVFVMGIRKSEQIGFMT